MTNREYWEKSLHEKSDRQIANMICNAISCGKCSGCNDIAVSCFDTIMEWLKKEHEDGRD
jgi:hypothetical protein